MRDRIGEFESAGVKVMAMAAASPETVATKFSRGKLPYTGLADPDGTYMDSIGQNRSLLKGGRFPAHLVLNAEGKVLHSFYGETMRDIIDIDGLLDRIAGLNA